jgi:hypothetical protein
MMPYTLRAHVRASPATDSIWAYTVLIPHLKMRRHNNVPPNYRIEKYHQLLDICFVMVDWPEARSSWVSNIFCISPSLCNFIKSQHFKQRICLLLSNLKMCYNIKKPSLVQSLSLANQKQSFFFSRTFENSTIRCQVCRTKESLFTRHRDANFIQRNPLHTPL